MATASADDNDGDETPPRSRSKSVVTECTVATVMLIGGQSQRPSDVTLFHCSVTRVRRSWCRRDALAANSSHDFLAIRNS